MVEDSDQRNDDTKNAKNGKRNTILIYTAPLQILHSDQFQVDDGGQQPGYGIARYGTDKTSHDFQIGQQDAYADREYINDGRAYYVEMHRDLLLIGPDECQVVVYGFVAV